MMLSVTKKEKLDYVLIQ